MSRKGPKSSARLRLANARLRLADLLEQNGRGGEALPLMREAGATVDQMLQHDPQGRRFRIVRLEQRSQFARLLTSLGRLDEAASILAGAERDGDELARGDPNDISANSDPFTVLLYQIVLARKMGQVGRATERCRAALDLAGLIIKKDPASAEYLESLSQVRQQAQELGIPDSTLVAAERW